MARLTEPYQFVEQEFDQIIKIVRNCFVENKNYKQGYYVGKTQYELMEDIKFSAELLIERLERAKEFCSDMAKDENDDNVV